MYDETYGLRFDIYERVHLSDEVVGIDQLEEVELTPHIQIIPSGEQVTVRGSLLLSGAYVGITEGEHNQSLEHWIPVEITLPLSRVRSLEEIHVDIEHFDVDLLSTRSLNITGVLSLKGIYLDNQEVPAWQQEQFTVEYESTRKASDEPEWLRDYGQPTQQSQQDNNLTSDISSYNYDGGTAAISSYDSYEQDSATSAPLPYAESAVPVENHVQYPSQWIGDSSHNQAATNWAWSGQGDGIQADASAVQQREQPSELHPVTGTESTWTWDQSPWGNASTAAQAHAASQHEANNVSTDAAYAEEAAREQEAEQAALEDLIVSSGSEQPELHMSPQLDNEFEERDQVEAEEQLHSEKKEMKVAIGSSSPSSNGEVSQGLGFSKLLHSSKQARDKEREVEERQAREEAAQLAQKASDDVHWQSLFLNQLPDESSFRKVRLCIVQRQETLDSIAQRYQMNAREIALYNRLPEATVTEGQVIYIPS
ncbi:LysM peptidoglycan-binding domain-containing protein [Paenibacillus agilis]|uniref:LysM peptidoglycan-binding domain-containing protein n=1 Tax=Paenibacillus agilis TaxID=3020863 RepID=A0A559IHU9_9BACL|nr:LysM peptidoglycan-binding domain-containing protein [Paenibacillus agilis]TVX87246.1 LysM peptidoglycan-binding domain-containing protein [Paenibacillus agilis]